MLSPAMSPAGKPIREKALLMGKAGSGKTNAWMSIADLSQQTGATRTFFAMETDRSQAVERYLSTTHSHLTNIQHRLCLDYDSQIAAMATWLGQATAEDFLIVDLFAPSFYSEAQAKADDEMKVTSAQEREMRYWNVVKFHYQKLTNKVLEWPGHVLATAGVKKPYQRKDEEMAAAFGGLEVDGQGATRHLFLTNLIFDMVRPGDWRMSTLKDVGRKYCEGEPVSDFGLQYLVSIAGWSM